MRDITTEAFTSARASTTFVDSDLVDDDNEDDDKDAEKKSDDIKNTPTDNSVKLVSVSKQGSKESIGDKERVKAGIMTTNKKVLILSQRGDWSGCDQAIKGLEKSADPELGPTPLKDVCDPVTGNTPLMYAAMENKHTAIERMVALGCNPLAVNREKYSALHLASMYGKEDTVKCLLSYKADPSAPGGPQATNSVHLAASRPTSTAVNILRLLISTGTSQGKNLRMVADKEGNIPLLCAIEIGNVPVARELLLSSTQEQLKTGKGPLGDSAIHLAARKGDNDLVKLFIESGTKVDTQNVCSNTDTI